MKSTEQRLERLRRFQVGAVAAWIGKVGLKLSGWSAEGSMPDINKGIIIVAHHTSNWDFPLGMLYSMQSKLYAFWLGKHTLFKGFFGGFMRWLGGIPVYRGAGMNVVDQVAETFRKHKELIIVIAPEGTRKKLDHWKTGFYHMALAANVPIICGYIDYGTKRIGLGPILEMTGDINLDFQKIYEFYASITGKFPEKQNDVRPREK